MEGFSDHLDFPMYVLTVPAPPGGRPSGCLVGFATQCSISPSRFLVCVSKANHTFRALPGVRRVGVHLLSSSDRDVAELFGERTGDEVDKFALCEWTAGDDGVPVLARCLSWFVGVILDVVDLGDHVGLVVEPRSSGSSATALSSAGSSAAGTSPGYSSGAAGPLMYSAIRDLPPGHPA